MSALQKLSEESLTRPPEEVFDIICKLGKILLNFKLNFLVLHIWFEFYRT